MIEAPAKEPRDLHRPTAVRVEVVSRTFISQGPPRPGARRDFAGGRPRRGGRRRRSERLRQDHAAGADLRAAAARRRDGHRRAGGADAPAGPAAPLAERDRQRWARAARAGNRPQRGPRADRALADPVRAQRVRAGSPGGAVRGDAPARVVPAHAAGRKARARPGRAVRLARRDHPRGDAGLARPRARAGAANRDPGHPRRRGGGDGGRSHRRDVRASGPGRGSSWTSTCHGPGGAPTPRSRRCGRGSTARWGWDREACVANLAAVAAARGAARHLGAVRRPRRSRRGDPGGPRTRSRSPSTTTARCCGATSSSPLQEVGFGIAVAAPVGVRAGGC